MPAFGLGPKDQAYLFMFVEGRRGGYVEKCLNQNGQATSPLDEAKARIGEAQRKLAAIVHVRHYNSVWPVVQKSLGPLELVDRLRGTEGVSTCILDGIVIVY